MKIDNKVVVDLLGALVVTASLIFVGMQLLLDRKVALAEQYYNRSETAKDDTRTRMVSQAHYQDAEERWALGERPPYWDEDWDIAKQLKAGEISVSSITSRTQNYYLNLVGWDNIYFQYKQGLIDDNTWEWARSRIKAVMADSELGRAVYQAYAKPTIQPVIDQITLEIDSGI